MAKVVISGLEPWDGTYTLDKERAFNAREWHWVREVSGYVPLTLQDGFAKADPILYVAISVVAMCRAGKIDRDEGLSVAEEIAEKPWDYASIRLVGDKEDEERPLGLTSEPGEPSHKDSLENPTSSGEPSRNATETLAATP